MEKLNIEFFIVILVICLWWCEMWGWSVCKLLMGFGEYFYLVRVMVW